MLKSQQFIFLKNETKNVFAIIKTTDIHKKIIFYEYVFVANNIDNNNNIKLPHRRLLNPFITCAVFVWVKNNQNRIEKAYFKIEWRNVIIYKIRLFVFLFIVNRKRRKKRACSNFKINLLFGEIDNLKVERERTYADIDTNKLSAT